MSNSPTCMFVGGFHHTNHHCEVGFELVKGRCYVLEKVLKVDEKGAKLRV